MRILGIETSCDETAAAVVETRRGASLPIVLSNVVSSQIEIHKKYGGVVPEVAGREHVLNILPVINEAVALAGNMRTGADFTRTNAEKFRAGQRSVRMSPRLDAIAVTIGPGLITSLQVGVETAKVLSYVWKIPVISVNHIEGHIYANFIGEFPISPGLAKRSGAGNFQFPIIILTVSGGHTMLILMKGHGKYKVIGETLDDAAGEAFDKAAAMLGIRYPGGPVISKYADSYKKNSPQITNYKLPITKQFPITNNQKLINKSQIPNPKSQIVLPRPMINSNDYNFSFSGLKTALLYKIQKDKNWKKRIPEYAHEFQQAVIDVLISKTIKAARELKVHPVKSGEAGARPVESPREAKLIQQGKQFNGVKTIMLSGGVAANLELRGQMEKQIKKLLPDSCFLLPDLKYTTDNAAMIAAAGYFKALRKEFTPWQKLGADCNLEF